MGVEFAKSKFRNPHRTSVHKLEDLLICSDDSEVCPQSSEGVLENCGDSDVDSKDVRRFESEFDQHVDYINSRMNSDGFGDTANSNASSLSTVA